MPALDGFYTDKGTVKIGLFRKQFELLAAGTDLLAFAHLPRAPINSYPWPGPSAIPSEVKPFEATLKNGNKIRIWNCAADDSSSGYIYYNGYVELINNSGNDAYFYKVGYGHHKLIDDTYKLTPFWLLEGVYKGTKKFNCFYTYRNEDTEPGSAIGYTTRFFEIEDLVNFVNGSETPVFPGPDNETDPPGGDGEGPDEIPDDPIEVPEEPPITASKSGLLTIYTPSASQLHDFGAFLWSDLFSLDTFKKLFADPMEAVIGLSVLPIAIPHTAGAESINIGQIDSNVFAFLATKQFVRHDCGEIQIKPVWNTALDYSPYTKFSIFLPYIGTREIKADDVMGKTVGVTYMVDILSGSCTAHIKVNGTVLYQFSGSCAVPIPVTGSSWNNLLTSSIQLAGTGIAAAVTAGASTTVSAAASGLAIAGTAGLVANSKQGILRTGAVSGAAGMLGVQTPYIIRETMRQSLAKDYAHYYGYPSNITSLLGDLSGYTVVQACHLKNIDATGDELDEIERLLKDGVLL